ncbi:MAG: hypothetical protein HY557_03485 [Euryarchaeota archaeon]|nr:hypothetical protein [Euryarchaeota archaeon]
MYTPIKRSGDPRYARKVGGVARWLNIHIALSVMGFVFVAVHAGFPFKFQSADLAAKGYAGLATWLLLIVTISGVFGRYPYNRLPAMRRPFRLWKEAHIIVTALLFLFALIHILMQAPG